jgi:hypothetical protein
MGDTGVVVVPRKGDSLPAEVPGKVFVAEECTGEVASFSSTKVRNAVAQGDTEYVSKAMSPQAAALLLNPNPEQKKCYKDDLRKFQNKM